MACEHDWKYGYVALSRHCRHCGRVEFWNIRTLGKYEVSIRLALQS